MEQTQGMIESGVQNCCFMPVAQTRGKPLAPLRIDIGGPPGIAWRKAGRRGKLRYARPPSPKVLKPFEYAPLDAVASG